MMLFCLLFCYPIYSQSYLWNQLWKILAKNVVASAGDRQLVIDVVM